jgi:putative SOS response-associated peptidase YedK
MCSNYDAVTNAERLWLHFDVDAPAGVKSQIWPLYEAPFVRSHPHKDVGDDAVPAREALAGRFGLIPHWADDLNFGRRTYNARSETVAEKPSFREGWKHAHHCIVPAERIYEPDWRSGSAVPTRIQRKDGKPMGIAGLWGTNRKASGEEVFSFTMLTINADDHEFFKNFHKPQDEKRMVVILQEDQYDGWLEAAAARSPDFMRQFPAQQLEAAADAARGRKTGSK